MNPDTNFHNQESNLHDYALEKEKFERLVAEFKAKYPIEALNAIINSPAPDTAEYQMRKNAKSALKLVGSLLSKLRKETKISENDFQKLNNMHLELCKAVGISISGKVNHF